jgi:hypothetical protein
VAMQERCDGVRVCTGTTQVRARHTNVSGRLMRASQGRETVPRTRTRETGTKGAPSSSGMGFDPLTPTATALMPALRQPISASSASAATGAAPPIAVAHSALLLLLLPPLHVSCLALCRAAAGTLWCKCWVCASRPRTFNKLK